jgi:hypothetical protein
MAPKILIHTNSRAEWTGKGGEHVTDLILRKSKQLLPQPIAVLNTPFLSQELNDLIRSLQKCVPIPPDRIGGVAILHFVRIPDPCSTLNPSIWRRRLTWYSTYPEQL